MEKTLLTALLFLAGILAFGLGQSPTASPRPLAFIVFPFSMWVGFRLLRREALFCVLGIGILAVFSTFRGSGPFYSVTPLETWVLLLLFLVANFLGVWLMATHTARLRQAESELRSAQNQRLESELRKSAIVEAALDCIVSMDGAGRVIEWNPAAQRTFGFTRDEVLGQTLAELIIPPNFRQRHEEGLKRYLATGEGPLLNQKVEVTALRKSGEEFPVELAIAPIELGERCVFSGYLRDLTDSKAAEAALQRAHSELEARVLERTAELQQALEQLKTIIRSSSSWNRYATA